MSTPKTTLLASLALTAIAGSAHAQEADLFVHTFTPSTTTLEAGKSVTVSMLIQNLGTRGTTSFRNGFYLSTNQTISTSDELIDTFTMPALPILTGVRRTERVDLPSNLPEGSRYFGLYLDDEKKVPERNESNNTAQVAVQTRGVVDLSVESMSTLGTSWARGESVLVTSRIRNLGGKPVPNAVRAGLYLSSDADVTTADTLLSSWTIDALAADSSVARSTRAGIPKTWPLGNCWLGCIVDTSGAVTELDENNNRKIVSGKCYLAGGTSSFGTSCPGSKSNGTPSLNASGYPQPGASLRFDMSNAPKGSAAIFFLGLSKTQWFKLALPLSLAPFGAPKCSLYVSLDLSEARATNVAGTASFTLPLPIRASLIGAEFHMQAAGVDPFANTLGLSWTNGVTTKVGSAK